MNALANDKTKRGGAAVNALLYGAIAGLAIGIAALALYLLQARLFAPKASAGLSQHPNFDGIIVIDPPLPLSDFSLTNHFSEPTSQDDLRGRHTLLAFGFLHCPDICPMTLDEMQRVREMLGESAAQTRLVFVSVDGARDTPVALRHYFDIREMDGITGLTGADDDVRNMGETLGLAFEVSEEAVGGGYTVNHSAGAFLLDADGRWIRRYQFGVPARAIADDMLALLRD